MITISIDILPHILNNLAVKIPQLFDILKKGLYLAF